MAEKGRVVEVAVTGLSASSTLEFFEMAEKGRVDEAAATGFSTSSTHASTKYEMQRQISLADPGYQETAIFLTVRPQRVMSNPCTGSIADYHFPGG